MKCSFIPQFIVLIALGVGAGFIHSKVAPVKLTADKPPSVDEVLGNAPKKNTPPAANNSTTGQTPATNTDKPEPKKPDSPTAPPTAPPAAPANPSKPADTPAATGEEVLTQAQRDKGHITLKEAYTLFQSNTAYFVDTRKKSDYEEGHVKDAFGIPLAAFHGKTPELVKGIDRESPVVVYCIGGTCDESEEVAKNFNLMGYKKVYVMHAGFPGWKAAGYPVDTGPGIQEAQ